MAERQTYKFNQPTQPVYTSGSEEAWLSVTNAIGRFYQGYIADEKREVQGKGKVAGIAAATQIVNFLENGDDTFKVN